MAHCFTPIRGRRMRVTKVNALGRPVYGTRSFVTTSGFISVQFTPEIEDGEETTVKTAGGDLCQPPGTLVQVVSDDGGIREVPIEQVHAGQSVLSWAAAGRGGCLRNEGCAVSRVSRRDYDGDLITISLPSGKTAAYTQNHICLATIGDAFNGKAIVYVLRRDGDYRIGWTPRGDGAGNSLLDTVGYAKRQKTDALWVLSTHSTDADAALTMALVQHQFTLPAQEFESEQEAMPLEQFWAKVGNNRLDAARCVAAFGRDIEFPLWDVSNHDHTLGDTWAFESLAVRACNLQSGMLFCEVEQTAVAADPIGVWRTGQVHREPFGGTVYSMEVEKDHTYVANGIVTSNCVSEKACDALKWITVQAEFCQVDPCLFTLINDTWTELRDCVGDVVGWAESHSFSCDTGFAMEVWTDVTGYTPTTPGATGAWGMMLLPFLVGGTLGEQTIENGAVSFTITARSKKGSGWGSGPYDVMCVDAETGRCGPHLVPVGPEEPRRILLTTCPPPTAVCGCQPLSSPDAPLATVSEDPLVLSRMGVVASLPAGSPGQYKINWGDATATQDLIAGTPLTHLYAKASTYTVSIWDAANSQRVTVKTLTVPFVGQIAPTITLTESGADTTRRTVSVTVDNHTNGLVTIDWGDGSSVVDNTGNNIVVSTHQYAITDTPVIRTITAADKDNPAVTSQQQTRVPFGQVKPVVAHTGAAQLVNLTADNHNFGPVSIDWADVPAVPNGTNIGNGATQTSHTYTKTGAVAIRVWDPQDPSTEVIHNVTLPIP